MTKGDCVITQDKEDDKCYKEWLEKLYREDPRRTEDVKEEKSEERLYEGEVSPTRIASFKSHCCGRNNFVDLDKPVPLDDMKSNCGCDVSS